MRICHTVHCYEHVLDPLADMLIVAYVARQSLAVVSSAGM